MENKLKNPDFIFEVSWEVCNKVGGIYTVLSSRAKTLQLKEGGNCCFIGPNIHDVNENSAFKEERTLKTDWQRIAAANNLNVRIGRWMIPGQPIVVLVDYKQFFPIRNEIYAQVWEDFKVDSLHGYGDYDEASMFSFAAGRFVELIVRNCFPQEYKVIYQAHEWMSGLGMLYLKKHVPEVATIFTTHATSIGRSIAGNNKELYTYFKGYDGDQMARELNMEAKHSIEKRSAENADCFTTVSNITNQECLQLLGKGADVILPNGFEKDFVPKEHLYSFRQKARSIILNVISNLLGTSFHEDTFIISTSGRNDFRCKGFDVFLESMAQLNGRGIQKEVIALIEVPCWTKGPRKDLLKRLNDKGRYTTPLDFPVITHELYNMDNDRILCMIRQLQLFNRPQDKVKVVLIPCYLEGNDGIFNLPYYNMLAASDLCIYPSYYEPWGYTPLESCAFSVPCITTDLSGFGQWVNETLGHEGRLSDGVVVMHRDDKNYFELSAAIATTVQQRLAMNADEIKAIGKAASAIADKAQWKYFIKYYYQAYDYALRHNKVNKTATL